MRSSALALCGLALALGCNYGFQGGGGFPSHVRSVYIEQFENQTLEFELENQIFVALLDELPRALGVRPAGRENADAVVRGRITGYRDDAQNYRAGQPGQVADVLERQVQVTLSVEMVDLRRNVILWEASSVTGNGQYSSSSQNAASGRAKAIEDLVRRIVDGAQSQW